MVSKAFHGKNVLVYSRQAIADYKHKTNPYILELIWKKKYHKVNITHHICTSIDKIDFDDS